MTVAEQNARRQAILRRLPQRSQQGSHERSVVPVLRRGGDVVDHADIAERMIRRLRSGMMPPVGAKRPDAATISALVNAFETRIDRAAALNPNPGWRPSQRLNRAEYQRAGEGSARGRRRRQRAICPPTRSATASTTSPTRRRFSSTLMEGYLRAASQISRLAVGDRNAVADARRPGKCRAPRRRCATSKARRSARAAACRCCTCSRPTANTSSRSCCTWDRPATCSAARIAASRSKSRSTASAWR